MGTELLTGCKQPKTIHSFIRFFAIKTANKMKKIQSQFCLNYDVLLGRTPHKIKLAGFVFAFICTKLFHRSRFGTLTSRWWVIYLASSVSWQPKITWCCHRGGPEGLGAWGARGAPSRKRRPRSIPPTQPGSIPPTPPDAYFYHPRTIPVTLSPFSSNK